MKMSEKFRNNNSNKHNNNNSYNPLTSRRTDGGENATSSIGKQACSTVLLQA